MHRASNFIQLNFARLKKRKSHPWRQFYWNAAPDRRALSQQQRKNTRCWWTHEQVAHTQEEGEHKEPAIFLSGPSPLPLVWKEEGVATLICQQDEENFLKQMQHQHYFNWIQLFGKPPKTEQPKNELLLLELVSEVFCSFFKQKLMRWETEECLTLWTLWVKGHGKAGEGLIRTLLGFSAEPLSSVSSLEVHFDLMDLTELTDMSDQELAEVFADSDEEVHSESPAGNAWLINKHGN